MPKNKNILNLTISLPAHSSEVSGIDGQFITLPNTPVKTQQNTNSPLIQKKVSAGSNPKLKFVQLIASNPNSAEKVILRPVSTEKTDFESILYLKLMHGVA